MMKYSYMKQYLFKRNPSTTVDPSYFLDIEWLKAHFGPLSDDYPGRWTYSSCSMTDLLQCVFYFERQEDHTLFVVCCG